MNAAVVSLHVTYETVHEHVSTGVSTFLFSGCAVWFVDSLQLGEYLPSGVLLLDAQEMRQKEETVKNHSDSSPANHSHPPTTSSFTSRSRLCVASLIIRYSVGRDNAIFFFLFIAYRPVFMTKDRASTFIFRQLVVYARKQCPPYTRPKSKAESFTIVPKKTP